MNNEENITGRTIQPIYILVEKSSNKKPIKESYQPKAAGIIGVLHVICGLIAFSTAIGLIVNNTRYYGFGMVGTGIWSSVFFFISGGLSIGSARNSNSCLIISTMIMSIFSAICAGILVIFSGLGLGIDECYSYYYNQNHCDDTVLVAMNGLQLVAGITEIVLAITSSSLSCKATCCRGKLDTTAPSSRVMYRPAGDMDPEQIVSLAMQMGQQPAGEQTGADSGSLPRYEDVVEVEDENNFGYKKF